MMLDQFLNRCHGTSVKIFLTQVIRVKLTFVSALKNMEYSKQLQVLEEANVKPKMTVELTIEYLMTLQPKVLDDLIERAKYLPNKDLIIEAMKELDHDGQRLIVKRASETEQPRCG